MAIQKIKEGKFFNVYHQTFLIDDNTDLDTLEQTYNCNLGDEAKLPDGTIYVRHSNDYQGDKWVVKSSGSSGSNDGRSDLPAVTSDDNGDVLTVVDGTWAKATPSSSLPAVTLADKGKHLVVNGKIYPTSTVIVPEQTASYDAEAGNYPLSNCVPSLFNDEGYVYAVINGTVASGTPSEDDIDSYVLASPDGSIWVNRWGDQMNVWIDNEEPPASITVSVYVGEEVGEWGKEAITTPAAVFDFRPGLISVVSGSYSATRAALEQFDENGGEMPFFLAYILIGSGQSQYRTVEFVGWQLKTGYIRLILHNSEYWHWNEDGSLEYED